MTTMMGDYVRCIDDYADRADHSESDTTTAADSSWQPFVAYRMWATQVNMLNLSAMFEVSELGYSDH